MLTILAAGAVTLSALFPVQASVLEAADLKTMIEGMGYEVKVLNEEKGNEKYEFVITKNSFDVPIAAEVSKSKNYVWFTAFLGKATDKHEKNTSLLKENFKIQPDFFYITEKGNLMLGIAVDNRGINSAVIRRVTDKMSEDVTKTAPLWQSATSYGLRVP